MPSSRSRRAAPSSARRQPTAPERGASPPAGLVDGAHTLTASQTDAAGNTGTATLSFTLDKTAPALSIALVSDTGSSASDGITSNPAIKGTGQANTVVTIMEGSTVLGTTTADATGAWSFTAGRACRRRAHPDRQPDRSGRQHRHGDAELHARQDGAGAEHRLVSDTGSSASDGITSNPAIKGTGQANAVVTIKEGSTVLGTTTADATGAWSYTPTGLADGAHTLTATQTDLAGNTGTATLSFTLDSSLAATALYGTQGNDILTGTIIGHNVIYGLGGNDTISVSYDSATTELYGGDGDDIITGSLWGADYIDGGPGNDILSGNWGNDIILGGDGNDRINGGAGDDIIYTGSGNDYVIADYGNDTIYCGPGTNQIDGGPGTDIAVFAGNYADYDLSFANGVITVVGIEGTSSLASIEKIRFQDGSYDVLSGLFLFNGPAPAVTMALVSDTGSSLKDKISSNPAVKGIGQVNSAVTITEGSAVLGTTTTNGSGTWNFTPIGLADGAHTFTATQTDLAGNTVTAMLSFTLDTTAPMVSFGLVSDTGSSASDGITSNPAIKGTGDANTAVTIKEGSTVLGTTTTDGTGAWSLTPTGFSDGAHTLTATQTDLAGNTGTATLSLTLDRAAPALSIGLVSDTGSSATDKITSNSAIKGTGDANTTVTIKEGSTVLGTTTASTTGAWSFTPAGLVDGAHNLTATQTDLAGNTGTATLSFTLDTVAPVLSIALASGTGSSSTSMVTASPAIKGTAQASTAVTIKDGSTPSAQRQPTARARGVSRRPDLPRARTRLPQLRPIWPVIPGRRR